MAADPVSRQPACVAIVRNPFADITRWHSAHHSPNGRSWFRTERMSRWPSHILHRARHRQQHGSRQQYGYPAVSTVDHHTFIPAFCRIIFSCRSKPRFSLQKHHSISKTEFPLSYAEIISDFPIYSQAMILVNKRRLDKNRRYAFACSIYHFCRP